jgi:hypothetical protein
MQQLTRRGLSQAALDGDGGFLTGAAGLIRFYLRGAVVTVAQKHMFGDLWDERPLIPLDRVKEVRAEGWALESDIAFHLLNGDSIKIPTSTLSERDQALRAIEEELRAIASTRPTQFDSTRVTTTDLVQTFRGVEPLDEVDPQNPRHLIYIPGFMLDAQGMLAFADPIAQQSPPGWTRWLMDYDSTFMPFATIGDLARQYLATNHPGVNFSKTVFFCHSEGGLIARWMIKGGFPCRGLVSLCTPHEGTLPAIPGFTGAIQSMAPGSPYLNALNSDPLESSHRGLYHCFALTYHDIWGEHEDDSVVPVTSALMDNLGQVASRQAIDYNAGWNVWTPVWSGVHATQAQNPSTMAATIPACLSVIRSIA